MPDPMDIVGDEMPDDPLPVEDRAVIEKDIQLGPISVELFKDLDE
jgi:hypothetical protein